MGTIKIPAAEVLKKHLWRDRGEQRPLYQSCCEFREEISS